MGITRHPVDVVGNLWQRFTLVDRRCCRGGEPEVALLAATKASSQSRLRLFRRIIGLLDSTSGPWAAEQVVLDPQAVVVMNQADQPARTGSWGRGPCCCRIAQSRVKSARIPFSGPSSRSCSGP